ncbi:MAG: hypothetical protein QOJ59_1283 [Thermomicrobiales bacterium]|jgi:hypothetical protein|nr:hypothetical protein [Thermomicrobiales bacterium]
MALERSYPSSQSELPHNTVVVLPKPLPMNRGALWTLFWALGLLMGLFARTIIDGPAETGLANVARGNSAAAGDLAAIAEAPTMEVHLRAVLELPSPTPTSTAQPTATSSPDPAGNLDFCANVEPGKLCKVPYPTPPPPTPYPSCSEMDQLAPGDWCVWPTQPTGLANRN